MVEPIETYTRPIYNAVDIKIRKPEVNAGDNEKNTVVNDNGIYNGVKIDIDNPKVNTAPTCKVYDYPQNEEVVTYDMAGCQRVALPQGFPVAAYESSVVVIPDEKDDVVATPATEDALIFDEAEEKKNSNDLTSPKVPEPYYTTLEAEKASPDETASISFHGKDDDVKVEQKKPEIVPSQDIKPSVDISKVVENLSNEDYDVQAQQMEDIVRTSLEDSEGVKPYLVRDVFASLIDVINKDTKNLEPPTDKQVEVRRKLIVDFMAVEQGAKTVPYELKEEDIKLANTLSPMEMAERNKEYAIATTAVLAKSYIDGVEEISKNVVPITDVPGTSAIVESLKKSQNAGVKVAAIDALNYIYRPEYKEELSTVFKLAQADQIHRS